MSVKGLWAVTSIERGDLLFHRAYDNMKEAQDYADTIQGVVTETSDDIAFDDFMNSVAEKLKIQTDWKVGGLNFIDIWI
jgi:hypothetical protein